MQDVDRSHASAYDSRMTVLEMKRAIDAALSQHPDLARRPVVDGEGQHLRTIRVHNPEGNGFTHVTLELR